MRTKLLAWAGLLLLACFLGAWAIAAYGGEAHPLLQAVDSVLLSFVGGAAATVVAVAFLERHIESLLQRSSFRDTMGPAAAFWDVPDPKQEWIILFKGTPAKDEDPQLRLSYPTFRSFLKIREVVKGLHGDVPVELKAVDEIRDWALLASRNVVLLGGYAKFPGLPDLYDLLELGVVHKAGARSAVIEVRSEAGIQALETEKSGASVTRDYGLVVRLIDPETRGALLAFSGGEGAGTSAAVAAMCSSRHVEGFRFGEDVNRAVVTVAGLVAGEHRANASVIGVSHVWSRSLTWQTRESVRRLLSQGGLARKGQPSPES